MQANIPLSVFIVSLLVANSLAAQEPDQPLLRIVVIAGQGTLNNIHSRTNVTPVVEVEDQNRKPLPGVPVTFFLPTQGPGGVFANSSPALTVTTDSQGRAAASGIRFNTETGSFDIRVRATNQNETATATISETNVSGSSSGGGGGHGFSFGTKAYVILGISAALVVTAAILATRSGSNKSGPAPIVITPGTPSVGAPQ